MGQILPEQLYYNFDKYTSSYKTKDGEVVEDKDELIELSGAIGMPDLIEHQTQLVDSIRKVKGYEDINFMDVVQYPDNRGRLVGMPQETLYPIFNASDAWKASDAKRDAAIAMDAGQSFNPTQTAKSVGLKGGGLVTGYNGGGLVSNSSSNLSNSISNFNGGGLVQAFYNGGLVASGLDFKNKQIKSVPKSPDISPPPSSSGSSVGAKITSLKMDGNNNPINLNQDEAPSEVPDFSATMMRSRDKIKTLGIMV